MCCVLSVVVCCLLCGVCRRLFAVLCYCAVCCMYVVVCCLLLFAVSFCWLRIVVVLRMLLRAVCRMVLFVGC